MIGLIFGICKIQELPSILRRAGVVTKDIMSYSFTVVSVQPWFILGYILNSQYLK